MILMQHISKPIALSLLLGLGAACENADEAAREAREQEQVARDKYNEKVTEAHQDAVKAYGDAEKELQETEADVAKKMNEAAGRLNAERLDARKWFVSALADVEKELAELREESTDKRLKITRQNFDQQIKHIADEIEQLRARGSNIESATVETLASTKEALRAELERLDKKVADLRAAYS